MASSPLRTNPTSLDDLPPELRCTLTQYLGDKDLGTMRLLSGYWNATARRTLRKRKRFTFNIENVDKLVQFNDTFTAYTPSDDIAAGRFCFQLPALDTAAAAVHLVTFLENFGHLVTTLSVNLTKDPSSYWAREWFLESDKCSSVLGHVGLLLQVVKGHVQDLELLNFAGLRPLVIGDGTFPRLRTVTVENSSAWLPSPDQAVLEQGFILLLSRTVPTVRQFEFKNFRGYNGGDPLFLANVLRTLVRTNPHVDVKLDMATSYYRPDLAENRALFLELTTLSVRVVELNCTVHGGLETLPTVLNWIGAQSDWLKKLTFKVKPNDEAPLVGLRLPSLRALEELEYVQNTEESLLEYASADYFPNLRKVTAAATGNDFTVTLPQVTELTLVHKRFTGLTARRQRKYGQAMFQLPPFPNLETLTCHRKFIDLGSIVKLKCLRRLRVTLKGEERGRSVCCFWKRVTRRAATLTLEEVRALPETAENEIREFGEPSFSELTYFKQLTLVVYDEEIALLNLTAVLFLSKTRRLQRLQKFEIELAARDCLDIPQVYLDELRQFHDSVCVAQPKSSIN